MFTDIRPYYAMINLDNFIYNLREIKNRVKDKKIIAVLKADAYGHGALELAKQAEIEGIDYAAVAILNEAIELRRNGFKKPILVLGYTPYVHAQEIVEYNITQTVFDYNLARAISYEASKKGIEAKIHIKVDTGMGRIGYVPSKEAIYEINKIAKLPNIKLEGIFTHFSDADEEDKSFAKEQLNKFRGFIESLKKEGIEFELKHAANSAAIIDMPETFNDLNAVRPGIILYGCYPSSHVNHNVLKLKPVMSLRTHIVNLKNVEKDTPISYGRIFQTKENSRIATLPFGYADGYFRTLSGKSKVILKGTFAPMVGRICMDQCMIDVTDVNNVNIGDMVTVLGEDGGLKIEADELAELIGTISYELLAVVSKRVPRIYMKDGKIIKVKSYI